MDSFDYVNTYNNTDTDYYKISYTDNRPIIIPNNYSNFTPITNTITP